MWKKEKTLLVWFHVEDEEKLQGDRFLTQEVKEYYASSKGNFQEVVELEELENNIL